VKANVFSLRPYRIVRAEELANSGLFSRREGCQAPGGFKSPSLRQAGSSFRDSPLSCAKGPRLCGFCQVRLMSPRFVRPYVKSNKNDARDAEAICEAVGRPSMRFVAWRSDARSDDGGNRFVRGDVLGVCAEKAQARPGPGGERLEDERRYMMRRAGANNYPAVQNIILACRAFGLGTLITTNHMLYEDEVKAVPGLPDDVQTYALMPIGHPRGKFGSADSPGAERGRSSRPLVERPARAVAAREVALEFGFCPLHQAVCDLRHSQQKQAKFARVRRVPAVVKRSAPGRVLSRESK